MLSRKALARSDWHSPADYSFPRVVIDQTRWLVMRLGHNLVKLRFYFWPVDVAVWAGAIGIAASQFLQPSAQTLEQEVRDLRCSGVLYRPNPSCLPLMKIRPPRCVPAR
jgi:hypothetical protein